MLDASDDEYGLKVMAVGTTAPDNAKPYSNTKLNRVCVTRVRE